MSDESYTNERVIGHHVSAERETRDPPQYLQDTAEKLDMELRPRPDYIRITEGDVDWEDTREVRVTVDELREMALHHTDLEEA